MKIRDHVDVLAQPTVVRLDQLKEADSSWISDRYYITEEVERHFQSLRLLLAKETGCGIFLIGHYGAGKSHFLAYLTQQLEGNAFVSRNPAVLALSLLHYRSSQSLESILNEALGATHEQSDRRVSWKGIQQRYPQGLVLILDELSEFLRSKPSPQSFNEDLRFLQFLGEWAQSHSLWVLGAIQEQIEHAGEMEYDLYRKIRDRYPIRFLLTPAHVKDLIAQRILRKKPSYSTAVARLAKELMEVYPKDSVNFAEFCEIYPLHPTTLELLEEVRDRFSQARGIIDFTLTRLLGNEARGIQPFLDEPWGQLITPDCIADHFADLFEIQPEFLPLGQKVLPYYRKQIPSLFARKPEQELAWRLLKLLILVHLSPRREQLDAGEAAQWLLLKVSKLDPARNREICKRILDTLVEQGAFLKRKGPRYALDLEGESRESLDRLIARSVEELKTRGDAVFETLLESLARSDFNPFTLPRDRWHARNLRWYFHDREVQFYLGGGTPPEAAGPALQIGIPWGPPAEGTACFRIVPRKLELGPEVLELAALYQLRERPLAGRVLQQVGERIAGRSSWFSSLVRAAYNDAAVFDPTGAQTGAPIDAMQGGQTAWLNAYGEWLLRQTYPLFERFAPSHGPLPKEAYRQFMKYSTEHDLGAEEAPEFVKLIREAYLVPMRLMQRRGADYAMNPRLDGHELVRLIAPILEHHPSPARIYQNLAGPVYGLVPDQIHLLLLTLLIQGEIDILKGQRSYREIYQTLIKPLQYDKIVPGRALTLNQLRDLEVLCEGFDISIPKQWTVLAQKRAIEQLRKFGGSQRDRLGDFLAQLQREQETGDLSDRVEKLIAAWLALEKGEHELQGLQHFLFAIGSPPRFVNEAREMMTLPPRFEKLLREAQRFRHLFGYPSLSGCEDPGVRAGFETLGPAPALAQPETLEAWLTQAQAVYEKYRHWYRRRHEEWRESVGRHAVWSYQIPRMARSRHLAAQDLVSELQSLKAKAQAERCAGMSPLDFQPVCRCGFDGRESPLGETLSRFEKAEKRLEQELELFFQQDKVKMRIQEWVDQKLELNTQALSYLEGKARYPDVENLSLFDQHLSGVDLVQTVGAETLLDLVGERLWEKSALLEELERFLSSLGSRITFRRREPARGTELLAWAAEQALRHGSPLPAVLSPAEQSIIAGLIEPKWVAEESLLKLEQMELGEEAIRRILSMVLDGLVPAPKSRPSRGAVAAALELLAPQQPASPEILAEKVSSLYQQNERFLELRPQLWLTRLNQLAEIELSPSPCLLASVLRRHLNAQWIVIDALGLPLLATVRETLRDCLARWKMEAIEFGLVSRQTSTDEFYRALIDEGLQKPFEKLDGIDTLIHNRRSDLDSLARLTRAELEVGLRRIVPRLDPGQPVVVFGDHGFRLGLDGRAFSHGGPSTLERITPVFVLRPS